MNPFLIAGTILYFLSAIWYFYNGQGLLAGMMASYGLANLFILYIK